MKERVNIHVFEFSSQQNNVLIYIYDFINTYMLMCMIYFILVNKLEIQITHIVSNHFSNNKHYAISWTCQVKMSILHIKYGKMTVFVTLYMDQCSKF